MQRLRSLHHKHRYTQIANDAIDNLPSLEAVGLLATILRHSDDFDFQMSVLIKSKPGLGEQKAYRARTTLIEHGYLVQAKFKHTYRGRMCTDIYRSPEPHTDEDLALLRERYAPGGQATIIDDDDRERQVTIVWAQLTSSAGAEEVPSPVDNSTNGESSDSKGTAKPQVAPDPGFPGPGQPGPGQPGPGQPGPGNPGSHKEDCSEESEKENPDPDGRMDESEPEDQDGAHREAAVRVRARMDLTKVGAQPAQVHQVDSALKRLLATGFAEAVVEQHAQRKLGEANTCKYLLNGLAPEHVVEGPGAGAGPSKSASSQPCGQCDARPGEPVNARVVWRDKDQGAFDWCPRCHPKVAADS